MRYINFTCSTSCTLFLCISVSKHVTTVLVTFIRYQAELRLMKLRLKLSEEESLWSGNKKLTILLECVIAVLHPWYILHYAKLNAYNSIVGVHTKSSYNDVMVVASMFRVLLISIFAISMTGVSSNRAKRISLMHGYELNFTNILKTITKESPFKFVMISGIVSIVLFAYCLRICER